LFAGFLSKANVNAAGQKFPFEDDLKKKKKKKKTQ